MFETSFFIEGAMVFAIGLWPLLLVIVAAAVRWGNARRQAAVAGLSTVSMPHPTFERPRTLAYAAGQ